MKKIFSLIFLSIFLVIQSSHLFAYIQETVDESTLASGWPALHKFLLKKEFNKVMQILDIYPHEAAMYVPVNLANSRTIELYICSNNHFDNKSLIECKSKISKMTSLEVAIYSDAPLEIIEKLIVLGANVSHERARYLPLSLEDSSKIPSRFNDGFYLEFRTALLAALIKQNYEVTQLLLNYGANPDRVIFEGYEWLLYRPMDAESDSLDTRIEGSWSHLNDMIEAQKN